MAATLTTVAKEAQVSVTTASRVLNGGRFAERISQPCVDHVREVATRLGYTKNYHHRAIRLGRAQTLGLALDMPVTPQGVRQTAMVDNHYFNALLAGVENATHEAEYGLLVMGPTQHDSALQRGIDALRQRRLDALVVPSLVLDPAGEEQLNNNAPDLPIVVIQPHSESRFATVTFDDGAGVRQAVDHLARLGHHSLLWFGFGIETEVRCRLRREVFFNHGAKLGLAVESCEFDKPSLLGPDPVAAGAQAAAHALEAYLTKASQRTGRGVSGIVCYNDELAAAALQVLYRMNIRVPDQMSVVGFDNRQGRWTSPPLSSVDHRIPEMGQHATRLALEMAMGNDQTRQRLHGHYTCFEPHMITRQSTGPPPTG